jgi:Protein tyrosine and serine/threonine kinase
LLTAAPAAQAAVGVVQHGLRPAPPPNTPAPLVDIMVRCWHKAPAMRPSFGELVPVLEALHKSLAQGDAAAAAGAGSSASGGSAGANAPRGGFFSKLRGGNRGGGGPGQ